MYQRNPKTFLSLVGKIERHQIAGLIKEKRDKEKEAKKVAEPETVGDKENVSAAPQQTSQVSSNVKLFADESLPTFFRRLAFSPDGSLLVAPAGVFPRSGGAGDTPSTTSGIASASMSGAATTGAGAATNSQDVNTVYIFGRRNLLE